MQFLDKQGVEYLWNQVQQNFANLSNNGKVPASQLPSYVDDVLEFGSLTSFPNPGEEGKIYVATDTDLTYRWTGSRYVEISKSLALGETNTTAYPGDKGKANADAIASETRRATDAENALKEALQNEVSRAKSAEAANKDSIDDAIQKINKEQSDRSDVDAELRQAINSEVIDRQNADRIETQARQDADAAEKAERINEDNAIKASLAAEIKRAQEAESGSTAGLTQEIERAKAAEAEEAKARQQADSAITGAISAEATRAQQAEDKLDAAIKTEASRAVLAENNNAARISTETGRAKEAEKTLQQNIDTEAQARANAISAEAKARQEADNTLDAKINTVQIQKVTPSDNTIANSYQLFLNGEPKGTTIDVAKDQSIKDIEVLDMNATLNSDGTIVAGSPVGSTALCISYILADGTYKLAKLDYQKFLEETEFADGLKVKDHKVYVSVDPTTENFITVTADGIKLHSIQSSINSAVQAEKEARQAADATLTASISTNVKDLTDKISVESQARIEADNTITSNLSTHAARVDNPHGVTKSQVGLGNADNTADLDKPISKATQSALDLKADADKYVPLKGNSTIAGDLTANSFIKNGGTNEQVMLADGTVAVAIPTETLDLILQ